jgi:hypothetical protein
MNMTHPDHDPDEAGLRALFDGTADELDGPGLTKLRARAADIPAQRRPAWWKLWAPALAVAMGGLVVFGVRTMNGPDSAATAQNTAQAPAPTAVALKTAPAEASVAPAPVVEDDPEELAVLGEDDEDTDSGDELALDEGSDDLLAFGVPSDDEELDAWLEATDELLGEGG